MTQIVTLVLSATFVVLGTTGAALAVAAIYTLAAGRGANSAGDDFARRVHAARRAALWRYSRWWLLCAAVWLAGVLMLRFAYDPSKELSGLIPRVGVEYHDTGGAPPGTPPSPPPRNRTA